MMLWSDQNRGGDDPRTSSSESYAESNRVVLSSSQQNSGSSGSLTVEADLDQQGRAKGNRRDNGATGTAERTLVAVTVSVQSGLQFQQHFLASETLEIVAAWGLHSKAIASDNSEEFLILQPAVRFTPSNLKRTLAELRLPRSVVLSVVKRTKKSAEAFAKAAAESSAHEAGDHQKNNGRAYSPPGAPVWSRILTHWLLFYSWTIWDRIRSHADCVLCVQDVTLTAFNDWLIRKQDGTTD